MKKFLIPVDFSAYSEKAVNAGIVLAEESSELRYYMPTLTLK